MASAGWYVAIVQLWPASSRPYIGGSQNNSILDLIVGYNDFGRLTGNETGSVGGGGAGGTGQWSATGLTRLFNSEFGAQGSWLLPAALILVVGVLALTWRAPRAQSLRVALLAWGGWLVVTGLALSLGQGIIHPYYTVVLAPPIGAIVGIGATALWARRRDLVARILLAATVGVTAWWSVMLLQRAPSWRPELRGLVAMAGVVAALGLLFAHRLGSMAAAGLVTLALTAGLAGPGAYSIATAAPRLPPAPPDPQGSRSGGRSRLRAKSIHLVWSWSPGGWT